jgi:GNAT superfamily N-acetyltransferase
VRINRTVVHASDGYPAFIPDDDELLRFIASPDAVVAWVSERGSEIVGHVALHRRTTRSAMALAVSRLGVDHDALGVVARLLVAPGARRCGIGLSLLNTAAAEARRRDLVPILDVLPRYNSTVVLYEAAGWTRLGTVDFTFPGGTTIEEYVYCAPQVHA